MSVTIGINGLGRIGRCLTRIVAATDDSGISIAAVNDVASTEKMAYGLRRDSIRGAFPGTVTARADQLVVNDHTIRVFHPSGSRGPTPASTSSSRPPDGSGPGRPPASTSPTAAPGRS